MQVKLDNVLLTGDGARGVSNLRINSKILVQEVDFQRATEGAQFARGNNRNIITFTVYHIFDDESDAEVWLLERGDGLLGRGLITITCKSGTKEVERYLDNAVVHASVAQQIGVSISVDYSITAGKFLKVKP